jgi:hypothetical protein
VAHSYNPSTREAKEGGDCEFKARVGYIVRTLSHTTKQNNNNNKRNIVHDEESNRNFTTEKCNNKNLKLTG